MKSARFKIIADGCIRDNLTSLEWTPTLTVEPVIYDRTHAIAKAFVLAGGGWRMPTPAELVSIIDYGKYNPATCPDVFPDTKSAWYWTGTVDSQSEGDWVWFVSFCSGDVSYCYKYETGFVRAVRHTSAREPLAELTTLDAAVRAVVERHGGMRAASHATGVDKAFISRLLNGHKTAPRIGK